MFKKSLLMLSLAASLSGGCILTEIIDISVPARVYATDEDDDDYDYLEIYDNDEEPAETTAPAATTEPAAETEPATTETPPIDAAAKPHILDATPKTADFDFSPQFALSLGVFFLGLSIFFLAKKEQD